MNTNTLNAQPLTAAPPARLQEFVAALGALLARGPEEPELMRDATPLLQRLIAHDDWLPDALARPHPQHYQQYLLHNDPRGRFSVASFVWGPSQATPVHDHTVWGLIGMLRGDEVGQPYRIGADGVPVAHGPARRLAPGEVDAVSPRIGDIHRVSNAHDDRVSISIHVYGADIGTLQRSVFTADGQRKPFVSGYVNVPSGTATFAQVRAALLARTEIALIDVREEDPFAQAHPLFAANLPLSRLELDAWQRIPRRDTDIVLYDNASGDGDRLAERALTVLKALGYTRLRLLAGGLAGWREAGGELFRDVNVPSKAFGELVESVRHTPSLSAADVKALLDEQADVVVLDARRFDEYQTMSIPGATSVPGAELVLRARELAPDPRTRVIVNCAGRTRSIIGTQSLVNAGLPNPVAALRNGTIGWTLAGQALAHGASERADPTLAEHRDAARSAAQRVAKAAGVKQAPLHALADLEAPGRTLYRFDVRSPEEYAAGHAPGFVNAPGGQLVQETDVFAPVRGARIALLDDDGVRAAMTGSWLAQMGWDVTVLTGVSAGELPDCSAAAAQPTPPSARFTTPAQLAAWLAESKEGDEAGGTQVFDMTTSANYVKRHIPAARFVLRSQWAEIAAALPANQRVVLTCGSSLLARFAAHDPGFPADRELWVLEGGTAAWVAAGLPVESGETRLDSPRIDRYRRPYEGTDNAHAAMQAYLDWEFGLVEQLARDGTHGFRVLTEQEIAG